MSTSQAAPTHHLSSGPSHFSTKYGQEDSLTTKRRKIAQAPPPSVYAGFSSTDVTLPTQHRPYRKYGETATTSGLTGKGGYAKDPPPAVSGVKVHQHPRSKYTANTRKVHRLVSAADEAPADVITPSSWRVGKELAERILKAQQRAEELLSSESSLDHASTSHLSSSTSHLSFRDSLDLTSHASSVSGHALSSPGHRMSSDHAVVPPEAPSKPPALSPGHWGDMPNDENSEREGSESPSSPAPSSALLESPSRAPQVSSDMNRLLEELRASSQEREESRGPALGVSRGKPGGPTAGVSATKYGNNGKLWKEVHLCQVHASSLNT